MKTFAKLLTIALIVLCFGCAVRKQYVVTVLPDESGHYVIVKSSQKRSGTVKNEEIFECKSSPDGKDWKPKCKEVELP